MSNKNKMSAPRQAFLIHGLLFPRAFGLVGVGGLGSVMAALCALMVTSASQDARQYQTALDEGGNVLVVTTENGGTLSAPWCDALMQRSDVVHSGGVSKTRLVRYLQLPGERLQEARVTPGFLNLVAPSAGLTADHGVLLGEGAAEALGASADSLLIEQQGGTSPVSGVVNVSLRDPRAARWVFVPTAPVGRVDECWVESAQYLRETTSRSLGPWLEESEPLRVERLRSDAPEDSVDASLGVVTRGLVLAQILLLAVLGTFVARRDRSAATLLRALGLSRRRLTLVALARSASIGGAAMTVAFVLTGVASVLLRVTPEIVLSSLVSAACSATAFVMTYSVSMVTRQSSLVEDLRDN